MADVSYQNALSGNTFLARSSHSTATLSILSGRPITFDVTVMQTTGGGNSTTITDTVYPYVTWVLVES
jgi:hypothetical protein